MLIITEGYTEKNYFEKFRRRNSGYELIVKKSPENTPNKIFKFCINQIHDLGLDVNGHDVVFCIFDVDYNSDKTINSVLSSARSKGINIILSNPCFEIFFLLHFTKKIYDLSTPKDTKQEIRNYILDYQETGDYWMMLHPMLDEAIQRSRSFIIDSPVDLNNLQNGTNIYLIFDSMDKMSINH